VDFQKAKSIDDLLKKSDISGNEGQNNSVTNTISKGINLPNSGNKSEKQPDQPLKVANLEILLKSIFIEAGVGATVKPSNCPAVARAQDYGKDKKGNPACAFQGQDCPYFKKAGFALENFYKIISCNFEKD